VIHNDERAYIAELMEALDGERLSLIDFDALRKWLGELAPRLAERDRVLSDVVLLRADAEARIGGMLKAIAAADQKRGSLDGVQHELDRLPTLTVAELLACRERVAAKFRDCFPTSYGLLSRSVMRGDRPGAYGDFK